MVFVKQVQVSAIRPTQSDKLLHCGDVKQVLFFNCSGYTGQKTQKERYRNLTDPLSFPSDPHFSFFAC